MDRIMDLKVTIEVSETSRTVNIRTSDYVSESEWEAFSEDEKREKLNEWLEEFDQPYWVVNSFKVAE